MFSPKRLIDILLSLIGLIILIPMLPVIGLLIKLDSRGPIFYLADRVGKDMKHFKMYKFRTMIETPIQTGESVCPQYDPRVTTFGRFLRRTKMNELPQFLNILKGDMTFVGPRPEAPDLAELYPEEAKRVFSVKPGLVGPNTLLGRNEEEFYPPGVDIKKYYIEKILPNKLKLDLEYVGSLTLSKDLKYIFTGVKETVLGAISKRHIQDNRSQIYLLIADLFLTVCSYLFVYIVYFWSLVSEGDLIRPFLNLPIVVLARLSCNVYFGMYNSLIRYISYHEILGVLKGVTYGSLLLLLVAFVFGSDDYTTFMAFVDWACLFLLLSGLRFGLKFYWEKRRRKNESMEKHRIFIYGAGDAGHVGYRMLAFGKDSPFKVLGFIDDAPDKYGKTLNGVKVLGNRHHIKALSQLYRVEEILVAEQDIEPDRLTEIAEICQKSNIRLRMLPPLTDDFVSVGRHPSFIRSLEFSDILPLKRIHSTQSAVREVLADKTILINGSGGALGLELCRKILQFGGRKLIIMERYESYLNELVAGLLESFPNESIVPALNDASRMDILDKVFETHRPNFVIHAGMRKYVPFLALDLDDIGRNNYLRTFQLAKTAAKFQCELFLMISSLMTPDRGNLVTDSLRVAEVSLEHFFSDTNTRFVITRICDVAENRGGIVSVIENQVVNQGTVILPSRNGQNYLISKHSAAEFILQTLVEVKKNLSDERVFICDGGSPISLIEIASKLANFYGLQLGTDLAVKYAPQTDEPVSTFPPIISLSESTHASGIGMANQNPNVTSKAQKTIFKNFVLEDYGKSELLDWKARTRELLNLCEPVF